MSEAEKNPTPAEQPFRWGDNEYATQAECEDAIAQYLVNELENYGGVVTCGAKSYLIKINATLIE